MTVIFTILSPVTHVAALPFTTGVSPFKIATVAFSFDGVAVIAFVALVVVVV
nr:hypothetical protein [uncultured Aminipila sp.]